MPGTTGGNGVYRYVLCGGDGCPPIGRRNLGRRTARQHGIYDHVAAEFSDLRAYEPGASASGWFGLHEIDIDKGSNDKTVDVGKAVKVKM